MNSWIYTIHVLLENSKSYVLLEKTGLDVGFDDIL